MPPKSAGIGTDVSTTGERFVRSAYRELTTVVTVSLTFSVLSVALLPIGGGLLALCEMMRDALAGDLPRQERRRLAGFLRSVRTHFVTGLPYSAVVVGVLFVHYQYFRIAVLTGSEMSFIVALSSIYVTTVAITWVYRAADYAVHVDETGFVTAIIEGGYVALRDPFFSFMQLIAVTLLVLFTVGVGILVPFVLPGLLALLEVVSFERLTTGMTAAETE